MCYDSKQIQVVQHGHAHAFNNILLPQLCDDVVGKPYFIPFMADLPWAVVLQVSFLLQSSIAALVQPRKVTAFQPETQSFASYVLAIGNSL